MSDYGEFLKTKVMISPFSGRDVDWSDINPMLYDFQRDITRWALGKGRAAVFADCGLGKTLIQLEWARLVGGICLIVAPLSVNEQTIREGKKLGITVRNVRSADELRGGINITNYEMIRHFVGAYLDAIVLDESSILKSVDGKTKKLLLDHFCNVPMRLCCTATPCPNDIAEIANHSHFLGVLSRQAMLASFFVHDEDGWRLRGHAAKPFYRWMSSWAMALKSPADLGYDASLFNLPPLSINDVVVETKWRKPGELFPGKLHGITDRSSVRRQSIDDRVNSCADVANRAPGQVIVWCGLNDEAIKVQRAIPGSVNLHGSLDNDDKERIIVDFLAGTIKTLVTKPKICGFGMNFQNASTMVFMGLSDSWESYYQCIRRSWRYGQKDPVNAYIVVSDHETEIVDNVRRKEEQAETMSAEIIAAASEYEREQLGIEHKAEVMETAEYTGDGWKLYQGDCVEEMHHLPDGSVDLSIFSPPFLSLYTYSASEKDIGNSRTDGEFFEHFGFAIQQLYRITKPGRLCCVHIAQVTTTMVTHGVIGLKDLRGMTIQAFLEREWVYHGDVCIDKDPQAQAIRTHSKALLFVQLRKDGSWLRPALADFILVFRKPGENRVPIHPDISNNDWIEWARPIWYGIRETNTLNVVEARGGDDDRHICALQLDTIERCVRLWSNAGETVFSPFAGIGSEGYVALQQGRRFIGVELKPLYAKVAARNLESAQAKRNSQRTLFETATA